MTVSVRSYLVAGLVAATVGTAAIVPVNPAGRTDADALSLRSSTFDLSAAVSPLIQPFTAAALDLAGTTAKAAPGAAAVLDPLAVAAATGSAGEAIINTFNAIEPFVQYGFELTAWAAGYLPWPIGWLGQQINIAYNTGEPIVQALVYSFAYLIDGQFDLIGPTLSFGLNLAVTNFVQGEINWVLSFLPPLPPLPPPPPFPTAAVASRAVAAAPVAAAPVTAVPAEASAAPEPVAEASAAPELVAETPAPGGTRAVHRRAAAARQSLPTPATVNNASAGLVANTVDAADAVNAADAAAAVEAPSAAPVKEPRRAARSAAVRAGSSGPDRAGSSGTDRAGPARSAGSDD